MIVVHIVAWVYCWVIQEKYTKNPPTLDWADKGFVEGSRGSFVVIAERILMKEGLAMSRY
jgi:hypothetical protein